MPEDQASEYGHAPRWVNPWRTQDGWEKILVAGAPGLVVRRIEHLVKTRIVTKRVEIGIVAGPGPDHAATA